MKVLLVSNMFPDKKHPSYGIFVKRFADELDEIGVEYDKSIMVKQDRKLKKALEYVRFYISTFCSAVLKHYDIIYIHYASHSSAPIIAASKFKNLTIFTNVHGSDVAPENVLQERMQCFTKTILDRSSKIIAPSEYFKELVGRKYIIDSERIYVYPSGGIDTTVFYERTDSEIDRIKADYGFDNGLPTFGMAGRISPGKGGETFIRAIRLAESEGISANYAIVGSGPQEEDLNSLIEECGLRDRILRIPLLSQEELSEFYSVLDYFVFPTEREGESLGLVALEAMACGTPVIASDFAAPAFYVIDGKNGYKFEKGSPQSLLETFKLAISVGSKKEKLKREAIRTAKLYDKRVIRFSLKEILSVGDKKA